MKLPRPMGDIVFDLAEPVEAGMAIAQQTLLPALAAAEVVELDRREAMCLWAGALASITGALAAAIGHEPALVLIESMRTVLPPPLPRPKGEVH